MILPSFFSFVQRLSSIYTELTNLNAHVAARIDGMVIRHEEKLSSLGERVARLEESRHTMRAETESELLKAVRQIERHLDTQLEAFRKSLKSSPQSLPPPRKRQNPKQR